MLQKYDQYVQKNGTATLRSFNFFQFLTYSRANLVVVKTQK